MLTIANNQEPPATLADDRWQAVVNRDRGRDGQFVFAVSTTGIYCRPSCPARRPRPENVSFFANPAAAERAGYRACLRCRPRAVISCQEELVAWATAWLDTHIEERVTLPRLAAALGPSEWLRFARFALLPARRLAEEEFAGPGEGAGLLLGGNAAHTDVGPEAAGSGLFGWVLACAGQEHGFPVPEGGAAELVTALVKRAQASGATVTCGMAVTKVVVRGGRAVAVRTADGTEVDARRAVLADVDAPRLLLDLVGPEHLPAGGVDDLRRRFQWDASTFKVDWALDGPVPWAAGAARRAGTVHVTDSLDELSRYFTDLATCTLPSRPFLLFGQQSVADPARCPPGTATGWAYTHVPQSVRFGPGEAEAYADRIEARVEELAPGFRSLVRARHVLPPDAMEAAAANLHGGAVGGGTQQLHQQLVFRPTTGLGRPSTPVAGLFLAGSSAHPGPGVHGACGANAARAAVLSDRLRRARQTLVRARRSEIRPPSTRTS